MKWIIQEEKEEDRLQILNKDSEIGIDEVGRGAVFGPIFSAAVVLTEKNGLILKQLGVIAVSYTHLTLPTIYSV